MVNKIDLKDEIRFNELGLLINCNFSNLYKLGQIINSQYDSIYGYYDNNFLVGFIHITKLYETVDIVNIVVDCQYRKKGIATKLINYVICLFDDIDNIMLEVNEKNLAAISLYKKNKFKIISKRKNYYGKDTALIMKRDVDNGRC